MTNLLSSHTPIRWQGHTGWLKTQNSLQQCHIARQLGLRRGGVQGQWCHQRCQSEAQWPCQPYVGARKAKLPRVSVRKHATAALSACSGARRSASWRGTPCKWCPAQPPVARPRVPPGIQSTDTGPLGSRHQGHPGPHRRAEAAFHVAHQYPAPVHVEANVTTCEAVK
jgi:hypothetical protein